MLVSITAACIGCGRCAALCPKLFRMEQSGTAGCKTPHVPAGLEESANQVYACCPSGAIELERE